MKNASLLFPSKKLNSWQMGSIFGSAIGLPSMLIGGQLARELGAGSAIISIFIGNLILWIIGLGIVSMSKKRNDAIENIKGYLGNTTGIIATLILIFPLLFWFAIQVKAGSIIAQIVSPNGISNTSIFWLGTALGLFVSILSFGGIRLIAKFCFISIPVLMFFVLFIATTSRIEVVFQGSWGFSLSGMLAIVFTWLPGTVNFPTFFRHSKSKADSFFAISLITFFHIFYQVVAVFAGLNETESFVQYASQYNVFGFSTLITGILLLFFLSINLVNIYYASAGWDALIPFYRGIWKFPIIGILGTLLYICIEPFTRFFSSPLTFIENALTSFISNLGVILLIDYLISIFIKHRPRKYQKFWSSICWFVGCLTGFIFQIKFTQSYQLSLLYGIGASLLSFLLILFIEQTIWSIQNLHNEKEAHIWEE